MPIIQECLRGVPSNSLAGLPKEAIAELTRQMLAVACLIDEKNETIAKLGADKTPVSLDGVHDGTIYTSRNEPPAWVELLLSFNLSAKEPSVHDKPSHSVKVSLDGIAFSSSDVEMIATFKSVLDLEGISNDFEEVRTGYGHKDKDVVNVSVDDLTAATNAFLSSGLRHQL